jgi:hypothetical protein
MSEPETMLLLVRAIASGIGGTADMAHLGGHVAVSPPGTDVHAHGLTFK